MTIQNYGSVEPGELWPVPKVTTDSFPDFSVTILTRIILKQSPACLYGESYWILYYIFQLLVSSLFFLYCTFWVIYCLYSNPQSMRNKQNQLEHLVVERRCDLIGVMDTRRDDSLHLAIEQCNSLKKNRSHRNAEELLKILTSALISKWVIIAIL